MSVFVPLGAWFDQRNYLDYDDAPGCGQPWFEAWWYPYGRIVDYNLHRYRRVGGDSDPLGVLLLHKLRPREEEV